ncbi:MAG: histidine kinase [Holophaga sp.]|nr:histidine kinase [Holophaga sp.]
MRQEIIIKSLLRRVSEPANLLMVGLVGGMFCLFQLVAQTPNTRPLEILLPFLLLFGHLSLAPVPWQWTGNDEDRAGFVRGFGQALAFDLVWVGLVLYGLHMLGWVTPPPHPPNPFPPMGPMGPLGLHPRHQLPFRPGLGLGLVNLAFGIAFGWVYAAKEATEAGERRVADLLRHSQARVLQNQLEPHVLYNALNGLAELVHEDPLAAEEMIAGLADLYRMLTVHGDAAQIHLEQERRLVEAYLDMEQMRLGERLQVTWQWPPWADVLRLPPFYLLPMVENAIKHGISPAESGGQVVIACARMGAMVQLSVENTGAPLQGQRRGVGLGNLEARLALWTEMSGSFTLAARGSWTVATLQWQSEAV